MNVDRRALLGIGAGVLAGTAVTGCGPDGAGPDPATSGRARPPARIPYQETSPDLPAGPGVPPAYFNYPAEPEPFLPGQVGTGGPVVAMLEGAHVATPKPGNSWLQRLDRLLNVELSVNAVVSANYRDKLSVTLAGGEVPDLTQIVPVPQLPQVLDKFFVDLGDYLGGDRVAAYPALAALPETAWTAGMVNGRLYGVAQPRSTAGRTLTARSDIVADLGLSLDPTDGQAFIELCREVTDARDQRWAFGQDPTAWLVRGMLELTGAPNRWLLDGGRFVRDIETEQYQLALEIVRQLWQDGLVHPDSYFRPAGTWWSSGTIVFYFQAFEGWARQALLTPELGIAAVVPPKWEGGGAASKHLGPGHYVDFVAIKKSEPARVEELLRVINFLAAPFGSREYLEVNFGIEGEHYTLDGSNPTLTDAGDSAKSASLGYVGGTEFSVLYLPGQADVVRRQHEYLSQVIPSGVPDDHLGRYSPTDASKGQAEEQRLTALQSEIIQGRQPVSAFPAAVDAWRRAVGDQIRDEYLAGG